MRGKRIVSLIILLSMLLALFSGLNFTVSADDDWDFWAGKVRGVVMLDDEYEGYFHSGDTKVGGITVNVREGGPGGTIVASMETNARGEYYFTGLSNSTPYYIEFVSPYSTNPLDEDAKRFKGFPEQLDARETSNVAVPANASRNTAGFTVDALVWSDAGGAAGEGYEVTVYAMMENPFLIHFIPQQGDYSPDPVINPTWTKAWEGDPIDEWPTVTVANPLKRKFIGWYVENPDDCVSGEREAGSIGYQTTGLYHENNTTTKYVKEIFYSARVDTLIYDVVYRVYPFDQALSGESGRLRMHNSPVHENQEWERYIYPGDYPASGPFPFVDYVSSEPFIEEVEGDETPSQRLWPDPEPDTDWYFAGWTRDLTPYGYDEDGNALFNIESTDPEWPTTVIINKNTAGLVDWTVTFTAIFYPVPDKPRVYVPDLELYVGDNLFDYLPDARLIDIDGRQITLNYPEHRDTTLVDMTTPGTYPIIYTVHTEVPYNHAVKVYYQRVKVHGYPYFVPSPPPTINRVYGNPLSRADLIAGVEAFYERASDTIGAATTTKEAIVTTDTLTPRALGTHNITLVAHVTELPDYYERYTEATRIVNIIGSPDVTAVKSFDMSNYPSGTHYNKNVEMSMFSTFGMTLQYQNDSGTWVDFSGWLPVNLPENTSIIKDYTFRYKEHSTYTVSYAVALSNIAPILKMDGAQPTTGQQYTKKLAPEIVPGVAGDPIGVVIYKDGAKFATYSGLTTLPALTKGSYEIELRDSYGNSSTYSFVVNALKVTYIPNAVASGNTPVDDTDYYWGDTVTVKDSGNLAVKSYKFDSWNTQADGLGTTRKARTTFTINDNTSLYGHWVDNSPSSGSGGGGSGGDPGAKYDEVVIECKDETGRVIHTHTEKQQAGQKVTFKAPELPGYKIVGESEIEIVVGDKNTKVNFEYVRDDMAVDPVMHVQYLKGYPDSSIGADGVITRAEAAAILYRLMNDPNKYATQNSTFKDVNSTDWFAQSVEYLAKLGVITGYEDGTFRPNNNISRAEFAVIIARFSNLQPTNDGGKFADVSDDFWAKPWINAVEQRGWIGGFPDGSYKPSASITRAQVASVVNRMQGRKVNMDSLPEDLKNSFWDLPITHWAYADVMEAAVDHEFVISSDGYEIWHK